MDEALKEARAGLARQIRGKGLKDFAAKLDKTSERIMGEFEAGLRQRDYRAMVLGSPPPPDTLGGVYGTRPDKIWVDDVDPRFGMPQSLPPSPPPPVPPKLNNDWMYPPPLKPAVQPTVEEASIVAKVTATSAVYDEYEQFKVWLYRMIAEAQDDTSPAFVHSVAKIKFQPLRAAVAKVVKLGALNMLKNDTKERLVNFQQWVDGVKPDHTWQGEGGKLLLSSLARVIDPYAT